MSKPIVETLTRRFMESSTTDRERRFEKILKKDPKFQQLSNDLAALEKDLEKQFTRLAADHPEFKKGRDDYNRGGWKKYL